MPSIVDQSGVQVSIQDIQGKSYQEVMAAFEHHWIERQSLHDGLEEDPTGHFYHKIDYGAARGGSHHTSLGAVKKRGDRFAPGSWGAKTKSNNMIGKHCYKM